MNYEPHFYSFTIENQRSAIKIDLQSKFEVRNQNLIAKSEL